MKTTDKVKEIYSSANDNIYFNSEGLCIRDVTLDLGVGEEIMIGQLSDIHFNYCNEQDFSEADPVVMSTYEYREWNRDAATVPKARSCFEFLDDADFFVINGDTMDYLSHGAAELTKREVFEAHPNCIATIGGHESAKRMQGKVDENTTLQERLEIVQSIWPHDIYYASKLLKDKILVVGIYDNQAVCPEKVLENLKKDIAKAREKGYFILLFAHEPFVTGNPKHTVVTEDDVLQAGDVSGFPKDFYRGLSRGNKMVGSDDCDDTTKEVYKTITTNADVIKGIFAGHFHNDMYFDILAETSKGEKATIPQYIHTATAYSKGHLMRILIK